MDVYSVLHIINLLAVLTGVGVLILVGTNYLTKWSSGHLILKPGQERISFISLLALFIFLLIFTYVVARERLSNWEYKMAYTGLFTVVNTVFAMFMVVLYNRSFKNSRFSTANKEFKELFQSDSFGLINARLIELGIIDQYGKWIGGPLKRKRDISVLMSLLVVNGILITDDYKQANKLASQYFQTNFDYVEMTALIKNYQDNLPEKKDAQSYKLLDFINNIQC